MASTGLNENDRQAWGGLFFCDCCNHVLPLNVTAQAVVHGEWAGEDKNCKNLYSDQQASLLSSLFSILKILVEAFLSDTARCH